MKTTTALSKVTRREFLATTASGGAALVIGFYLPLDALAQQQVKRIENPNPFNAWVRIDKAGQVTLIVAKSEMGQGVYGTLPMILAEELEVDWARVRIEQAPTDPRIYSHGTGGSSSVRESYAPLRRAGATAREMLIAAAAQTWGVPAKECRAEKGAVWHGQRSLPYGELVEKAAQLPLPDPNQVPLKEPAKFRIIGTSIPRADVPLKVDGSAKFGLDVKVPGMLYAVVARCPTFGGQPKSFNAAKAKAVPGVKDVVQIPAVADVHSAGGVAVVAESTWAAMQGREALEVEWDYGPHAAESSESLWKQCQDLAAKPGKSVRSEGDVDAALGKSAKKIEADYQVPFVAHATMEPMNCTVHVRPDGAEVWAPTQAPQWAQGAVAQVAGVEPSKVVVHTTFMGGGFGRRYQGDYPVEAAQVSKAVGKPVKLVWTREDDMQHDFYRPASFHRFQGTLDAEGKPAVWQHRIVSTAINSLWSPKDPPEQSEVAGAADLPYAFANLRIEYAPVPSGVPVAWWRSVESSQNALAVECFMDEMAAAAGVDPLEFRLRLLAEPRKVKNPVDAEAPPLDTERLKGVLKLAAEKAGWGSPLPKGRGRGIAAHYSFQTYVAEVAEVTVEGGKLRVDRVVAAVDCGTVINPEALHAQVESAIVYGLSAALYGEITIEKGGVKQSNFHEYDLMRIDAMPKVEVYTVRSTERPTGIGEPGLPPATPAVLNAIFAATGKRLRRLPIRAEDLA
ncbi:MAG TPA: xanthine dehydrogenase family protein molybdopterin-binding subunit [Terriglobales bacterium]|nr:xanthine dehydrogenase family protein molybdopterin-binding subunit [Terriglobales bacterium]